MALPCGSEMRWTRAVKMIMFLFFVIPMSSTGNTNTIFDKKQKLEIQQKLKRLNKPALKTIESPDGDIIDCVDIKKQPAFDHPLLKNHTIQMRPSSYPKGILFNESNNISSNSKPEITQRWHLNGRCPEGTIPIRRTKEEDLLRASSIANFGRKKYGRFPNANGDNMNDHEYAVLVEEGEMYYGMNAEMNVWNPHVQEPIEFSESQFWMVTYDTNGASPDVIEAGWMVYYELFKDYETRLFTHWTADGYRNTGCYNLDCPGFVQVDTQIALGASITPTSEFAGAQRSLNFLVYKDNAEGHWWLQIGMRHLLGYWPSNLFEFLSDSAARVLWGGEVVNKRLGGKHTTTQMGNGHFAEEGPNRAGFFQNLRVIDAQRVLRGPENSQLLVTNPNCYNLLRGSDDFFYYGGPGRNVNCP